jgi:hypothetical protein
MINQNGPNLLFEKLVVSRRILANRILAERDQNNNGAHELADDGRHSNQAYVSHRSGEPGETHGKNKQLLHDFLQARHNAVSAHYDNSGNWQVAANGRASS